MTEEKPGSLTHDQLVKACKNIGYDLTCGQCASLFYAGFGDHVHDETCTTEFKRGLTRALGSRDAQIGYEVYRIKVDDVAAGAVLCRPHEQTQLLRDMGLIPSHLRRIVCHGDFEDGNYLLYDPTQRPILPFLLLKRKK